MKKPAKILATSFALPLLASLLKNIFYSGVVNTVYFIFFSETLYLFLDCFCVNVADAVTLLLLIVSVYLLLGSGSVVEGKLYEGKPVSGGRLGHLELTFHTSGVCNISVSVTNSGRVTFVNQTQVRVPEKGWKFNVTVVLPNGNNKVSASAKC